MKAGPAALSCSRPIGMMGPQVQEKCRESGDFFTELLAGVAVAPHPARNRAMAYGGKPYRPSRSSQWGEIAGRRMRGMLKAGGSQRGTPGPLIRRFEPPSPRGEKGRAATSNSYAIALRQGGGRDASLRRMGKETSAAYPLLPACGEKVAGRPDEGRALLPTGRNVAAEPAATICQPMAIRLALPPAAAVLMEVETSSSSQLRQ